MFNLYGAIINNKGPILFTPVQNSLLGPLRNVFGVKGRIFYFDHLGKPTTKEHTVTTETRFYCIGHKFTLLSVGCTCAEGTIKMEK